MSQAEEASAETDEVDAILVVRDSTFARAVADKCVTLDLGRDIELAFLQVGPIVTALIDHESAEEFKLNPVMTEVSRIRMPWHSAVDLAMHILREGVARGSINSQKLVAGFEKYINTPNEAEDEESGADD